MDSSILTAYSFLCGEIVPKLKLLFVTVNKDLIPLASVESYPLKNKEFMRFRTEY